METSDLQTEGRPVEVFRNGQWLPGAIMEVDRSKNVYRITYTTKNGKARNTTAATSGDGTLRLKRGSTITGTGVTGKRFPRDAKTHKCGTCGLTKPARQFPTDGPDTRLGECRSCRDERTPSGVQMPVRQAS